MLKPDKESARVKVIDQKYCSPSLTDCTYTLKPALIRGWQRWIDKQESSCQWVWASLTTLGSSWAVPR